MTELEIKQYIGQKLREHRKAKNLTIEEVAKHLKLSTSFISQTESGYNLPSFLTLKKYLDLYGVKSSDILPF